jgi:mono/diheme cytochrome c family protein
MTLKKNRFYLLLLGFIVSAQLIAQPSADAGKTTFRNYCASCHAKDMKTASTGPALGGTEERWASYPREDLYGWIRNSQAMIKAGQPRAVELWEQYKPTVMTPWPNLTDDDIESLLIYINQEYTKVPEVATSSNGVSSGTTSQEGQYNWLYYVLFGLLGILAIILTRIIGSLDNVAKAKAGEEIIERSLVQRIFTKRVISFLIFGAVIFGGFTTVTKAINLGRQQGYAPDQPINFSHAIHAGENQIDCQYCHDGARRSKHAVIPATNTCMNCHSAIKNGSNFGTAELTKIYVSSGYDPSTNKYIEDYDKLSESEIEAIYTKWISESYLADKGLTTLDKKGEKLVEEQWSDIMSSLTNGQKKSLQGPIEWIRIHNLPDHVYFNHAQHVTVGGVECQTCHGKVEEMSVVQQYAPLSMGWCINCHRQTQVNFEGNDYYKSYELYHEQLAKGEKSKITVEDIGGLECQKCHY